eukprot:TRINITY_DN19741_c0_g1_i1.p1 TRINITY_DN19741_c0_g1~~TRINITY_DN19741_c0_g1_i1.p1  ORF type:complete len:105 (+),score=0.69 TRINITY_DN19741_c0_g1_i1:478-792(+)
MFSMIELWPTNVKQRCFLYQCVCLPGLFLLFLGFSIWYATCLPHFVALIVCSRSRINRVNCDLHSVICGQFVFATDAVPPTPSPCNSASASSIPVEECNARNAI